MFVKPAPRGQHSRQAVRCGSVTSRTVMTHLEMFTPRARTAVGIRIPGSLSPWTTARGGKAGNFWTAKIGAGSDLWPGWFLYHMSLTLLFLLPWPEGQRVKEKGEPDQVGPDSGSCTHSQDQSLDLHTSLPSCLQVCMPGPFLGAASGSRPQLQPCLM